MQLNGKESIYKNPSTQAASRTATVFLLQAQSNFIFVAWYTTSLVGNNFLYYARI